MVRNVLSERDQDLLVLVLCNPVSNARVQLNAHNLQFEELRWRHEIINSTPNIGHAILSTPGPTVWSQALPSEIRSFFFWQLR